MKTWYVYDASTVKRRYLGFVKSPKGKQALRLAHEKFNLNALDVIQKRYIVDRDVGTIRGPKKT